jgi:uncharacterized protein YgiB involved in biofilm formation
LIIYFRNAEKKAENMCKYKTVRTIGRGGFGRGIFWFFGDRV